MMNRPASRRRVLGCVVGVVCVALAAATVQAQRRFLEGPVMVRITGYRGPKLEKPILLTSWKVNRGRDIYELRVIKLDVLTGNVAYFNIVEALEPYTPALEIAGDNQAIADFLAAPDGEPLVMIGSLRFGTNRILMLDTVERTSFKTPSPESK